METAFGALLRQHRVARHLSFMETGRSQPSREMVLALAQTLEVPPRECNALLEAAGFAAAYRETPLDAQAMAEARRAVELLLRQNEPFGAVAQDLTLAELRIESFHPADAATDAAVRALTATLKGGPLDSGREVERPTRPGA